ncbi:MAG: deoxyribose-phosphate aldolase [Gemmatimonadales bacterium]
MAQELESRTREILERPTGHPPGGTPVWLGPDAEGVRGIGRFLDYTLLKPEATRDQVVRLCDQALSGSAAAVCVNGDWVGVAAERLRGSSVRVAATVAFPLGATTSMGKFVETRLAVMDGASEIDMVMALGRAAAGDWEAVRDDIATVVEAAPGRSVKVILETAVLDPAGIVKACLVAQAAGARFVKTSTGFHPAGGATVDAVSLMRRAVGLGMGVKASGGIRHCAEAISMLAAGASRIGASHAGEWRDCVGIGAPTVGQLLLLRPPSPVRS